MSQTLAFACCSLPWNIRPALESDIARRSPKSREPSAISLDLRLERLLSGGQASSDGLAELSTSSPGQLHMSSKSPPQAEPIAEELPAKGSKQRSSKVPIEQSSSAKSSPQRPSLLRQGSSSASSSEELIGALHSPTHQAHSSPARQPVNRQPAKSPLPAPPTHLKV